MAEVTLKRQAHLVTIEQRSPLRNFVGRLVSYRPGLYSLILLIALYLFAFVGPHILGISPNALDLTNMLAGPSSQHLLGTDANGRDTLSRLMSGGQVSLIVGLIAILIANSVGILLGALSGYFGHGADLVIMRFTDAMLAIPTFLLLLVVLSEFSPTLTKIELAIGLTSWMTIARLVRGEFLRLKDADFVLAARAIGATNRRIIFRHLLPQAASPIIVASSVLVGSTIIIASALSYLGLGIQPPQASWGNLLTDAQQYIYTQPALAVYPGVLILLTVAAFNYFGEGLRIAFNVTE